MLNPRQIEARDNINRQLAELRDKYKKYGKSPSEKDIINMAREFYQRDRKTDVDFDFEMLAVERGIVVGMQLMRGIIERNEAAEEIGVTPPAKE